MVTSSKPTTITEAIDLSVTLTEEAIRLNKFSISEPKKKETHVESSGENKRKFSNFKKSTGSASKRRDTNSPAEVKTGSKQKGKGYMGSLPKCDTCKYHHLGQCRLRRCEACGKEGHSKNTCWVGSGAGRGGQRGFGNNNRGGNGNGNRPQGGNGGNGNRGNFGNQAGGGNRNQGNSQGGTGNGNGRGPGCFNCGDVGHLKQECPKVN
ncbi:glycine, alanine and asparagine-rich protein-like [Helianthus annuus]|uniref:glycine, alanine and asparagine-rich protein-like n=1 Tax=Helianthus annuus TaxID=4232 RepID=UPI000B90856E|nr:glycine, alanine and asparagine-rich protein-like [Helianthus annuus]